MNKETEYIEKLADVRRSKPEMEPVLSGTPLRPPRGVGHSVKKNKCSKYSILYFLFDISGLVGRNVLGSIGLATLN